MLIVNELKTNKGFITDKVDEKSYFEYVNYVDHAEKTLEIGKEARLIEEIVKRKTHVFCQSDFDPIKRRPLKRDDDFTLKNYELKSLDSNEGLFKVGVIEEKETKMKFSARFGQTEINNFTRNEIIGFIQKVNIMAQLNHPSIQKFANFSPVDFANLPKPVVVLEYLEETLESLPYCHRSLSRKDESGFNIESIPTDKSLWNDTKKLINIYGIAAGMAYLHSHGILHRDLKPSNIYLDDYNFPKISGFHLSIELEDKNEYISSSIQGTPAYLSQEIYTSKKYSKSSDVYSFSLILYEIMTNQKPFNDKKSSNEIKKEICDLKTRPSIKVPIPPAYRTLIERCWSEEPTTRPTFDEILDELRTNPDFITESVDKEDFYEYVNFLDNFNATFDPENRVQSLDDIRSRIHTFHDIRPSFILKNIYQTEMSDLMLDSEYLKFSNFTSDEKIKNGKFYSVYKLIDPDTNTIYAEKTSRKDIGSFYKHEIINFSQELNVILQLNHPAILKCLAYKFVFFAEYSSPSIITEYASKGTLKDTIKSSVENDDKSLWNDTKKLINIYGIAAGMAYLHSHGILHRDLKPSNIYHDDSYFPKISGFHLSIELEDKSEYISLSIQGTPAYLSQEIYTSKKYSKSSDVYSFSLILYEIMTNQKPFNDKKSSNEIKKEICDLKTRPSIKVPIPPAYRTLIERCWSEEPTTRPTFDEILDELRTNPDFITESVDKEEYEKYIKYIDETPNSLNVVKKIKQFKEFVQNKLWHFSEYDTKINFRGIYETEDKDVLFNYDFVNVENFEKQKLINNCESYKIYSVLDKEKAVTYTAKKYDKKFISFKKTNFESFNKELNIILELKHPSILKFIGYSPFNFKSKPKPIILTEFTSNGSLQQLFESKTILDETKKLIIIYGIASGMSYLHSHDVILTNLNPSSIYLDDFLFPKITKLENFIKMSTRIINEYGDYYNSEDEFYSPERMKFNIYSSAGDVYSFAMIIYQLISNEKPFSNIVTHELYDIVVKQKIRPELKQTIPKCYRTLIERCWSDDPKDRPTFNEIVLHLKTCNDFITDKVNKEEFHNYMKYIEEATYIDLSSNNKLLQVQDFIQTQNQTFRKVKINLDKMKNPERLRFSINLGSSDLEMFEKQKKLGSGSFGVVYRVVEKETDETYAAKVSIYEMDQCSEDTIMNLLREIDIISMLDHLCVLKFIGYSPSIFKGLPKPVIITEYSSNGSLDEIIEMERNGCAHPDWNDTKKLINIYGIAAGMNYLHSKNIVHRDLKPANILLDDFLYPKVADFGLSKVLSTNDTKKKSVIKSGFKGTYAYCAPEIIREEKYTLKGDVYACAFVVYEIMTSEIPFKGINRFQLVYKIMNGYRPNFEYPIPYCYRRLIEKCWSENLNDRPSFDKILYELETDPHFITSNVDKDEYLDFISLVNDTQKYSGLQKPLFSQNEVESKIKKNEPKLNRIVEEEVDELKDFFLDISKFERKSIILKSDVSKLYKLKEIKTGNFFTGQISMLKVGPFSNKVLENLKKEIDVLLNLSHPTLLKFIGFSPIDFKNQRKSVIVMELISNRILEEILNIERMNKEIQSWNETKKLMNIFGIASAMMYLHSHGIIHRCLQPSNVYLDDFLLPKIADFGLSTKFNNQDSMTHQSISGLKGTPIYSAPEVLQNNVFSKASDVYAFAFVVFEIMSSEKPFCEIENKNQIFDEVVIKKNRPMSSKQIPQSYVKLIERCWSDDPYERPTFEEIVFNLKMNSSQKKLTMTISKNMSISLRINKDRKYKRL